MSGYPRVIQVGTISVTVNSAEEESRWLTQAPRESSPWETVPDVSTVDAKVYAKKSHATDTDASPKKAIAAKKK